MAQPSQPTGREACCPRCGLPLDAKTSSSALRCQRCGGVFVLREAVEAFLSNVSPAEGDGYRTAAPPSGERSVPQARAAWEPNVRYLMCSLCEKPMTPKNFARLSGVIVDECALHGTWFDHGEAEAVARWVDQLPKLRQLEQELAARSSSPPSRADLREELLAALRGGARGP